MEKLELEKPELDKVEPQSNVITLSRFRADVSRALSRQGKDLLVSKTSAEQFAALAPVDAYFIVKELGLDEAAALLVHATPEQLQTFVDLDCWVDDQPDPIELDAWLAPFLSIGVMELAEAFLQLDSEVQVIFLAQSLKVYDTRSDEIPEETEEGLRKATPDGLYVIDKVNQEREVDLFVLVDALYKTDLEEAHKLLMAAKWEIVSNLEEQALQFRTSRMSELGFVPRAEALGIFSKPTKKAIAKRPFIPATTLPTPYAGAFVGDNLFVSAMMTLRDAATVDRLEYELVALLNTAVMAYGKSPRELSYVQDVAGYVRSVVSLGLEEIISPKAVLSDLRDTSVVAQASDVLHEQPITEVFRHGHAAIAKLASETKARMKSAKAQEWLQRHESENDDYRRERADRRFIKGLMENPPVWRGFDLLQPDKTGMFASKRDIEDAQTRLAEISALIDS